MNSAKEGLPQQHMNFITPRIPASERFKTSVSKFVLFLGTKPMLIFYAIVSSLILVTVIPMFIFQNTSTNTDASVIGSCRLKDGFMIDCAPEMTDEVSDETCATRNCCFRPLNRDQPPPVCYRRIPSGRGFNVTPEKVLIPEEGNRKDRDNPPFEERMKYRILSKFLGHVSVRFCGENNPEFCERGSGNTDSTGGLIVDLNPRDERLQIVVTRNDSHKTKLFDSSYGATIFGTKLSEITTLLSTQYVYGLSEYSSSFSSKDFYSKSFFNTGFLPDRYSSVKSVLGIDKRREFYGIYFESETPGEIEFLPGLNQEKPLLVIRTMGKELAIHIFAGPKPSHVSRQISMIHGFPKLPPKWVLGFHICRSNMKIVESIVNMDDYPYDSDCIHRRLMKSGFELGINEGTVSQAYNALKTRRKKTIMINPLPVNIDLDLYEEMQFINDTRNGQPFIGVYQNKYDTSIPDLTTVESANLNWWTKAHETLFKRVFVPDALHFIDNAPELRSSEEEECHTYFSHKGIGRPVFHKDLCPLYEFGVHNKNISHSIIRDNYPRLLLEKSSSVRPALFSEFSSPGIQKFGWIMSTTEKTKESEDEWENLRNSLIQILESGLSGIPLKSISPCTRNEKGAIRNEDACYRWFQVGAYMPLLNTLKVSPLDLRIGKYRKWIKSAIHHRYKLHPYIFGILASIRKVGGPLVRPLFYEFPSDERTFDISHEEFMLGDTILVVPISKQEHHDKDEIPAYFPRGTWYDLRSGTAIRGAEKWINFQATKFQLPIFMRRGKILPILEKGGSSIRESYINSNYSLIIGLDCDISPAKSIRLVKECSAKGSLFLPSAPFNSKLEFKAERSVKGGKIEIKRQGQWIGCNRQISTIDSFAIYGLADAPLSLIFPGGEEILVRDSDHRAEVFYSQDYSRLQASKVALDFCREPELTITWTFE